MPVQIADGIPAIVNVYSKPTPEVLEKFIPVDEDGTSPYSHGFIDLLIKFLRAFQKQS